MKLIYWRGLEYFTPHIFVRVQWKNYEKLKCLESKVTKYYRKPSILDKLIDLKFDFRTVDFAELHVNLILYCILVSGLGKTRGEKFDNIKEQIKPLRDILKEIFCVFDKNELHKERIFIFQ